jgi:hypothetical protein
MCSNPFKRRTREEVVAAARRTQNNRDTGYRSDRHTIMNSDTTAFGIVAGDLFIEGSMKLEQLQSHCDFLNDSTPFGGVYKVVPIEVLWHA